MKATGEIVEVVREGKGMRGLFIKTCDEALIRQLEGMGYAAVRQDIYFNGTMVTSDEKIRFPAEPFKPWNPDGKGWPECQTFAEEDKEAFMKAAEELIKKENV